MKMIVLGGTGAVGTALTRELIRQPAVAAITLLVRRKHADREIAASPKVTQEVVDVFDPGSYRHLLSGHELAFSTLGMGQASKATQEEFERVDVECVRVFAEACKESGVSHFSSLGSAGANRNSRVFYLKVKGELEQALIDLEFSRTSLFRPSMIITPQNRYGWTQWLMLRFYPLFDPLMVGGWAQFRSIRVEELGLAMARNALRRPAAERPGAPGVEILTWRDFARVNAGAEQEGMD